MHLTSGVDSPDGLMHPWTAFRRETCASFHREKSINARIGECWAGNDSQSACLAFPQAACEPRHNSGSPSKVARPGAVHREDSRIKGTINHCLNQQTKE